MMVSVEWNAAPAGVCSRLCAGFRSDVERRRVFQTGAGAASGTGFGRGEISGAVLWDSRCGEISGAVL